LSGRRIHRLRTIAQNHPAGIMCFQEQLETSLEGRPSSKPPPTWMDQIKKRRLV
jgi:hypothetical protein